MHEEIIKDKIKPLEEKLPKEEYSPNIRLGKPAKNSKVNKFRKYFNLPEELLSLYAEFDGFSIAWMSSEDLLCSGRVQIPNMNDLKAYITKPGKGLLKNLAHLIEKKWIPLDVNISNSWYTFMKPTNDSYKLVYVDFDLNEVVLDVNIREYLNLALEVGGINLWQNYISTKTFEPIKNYSDDGFHYLTKTVLTGVDTSLFYKPKSTTFLFSRSKNAIIVSEPKSSEVLTHEKGVKCSASTIRKAELSIKQKLPISLLAYSYTCSTIELR
jgi:hypothetical protein